ncbi:hypothetical protein [Roseobacter sp. HKCCA0434]|uniref:hypothetical protein n=1 Tax=Roseobacter sp. HKCCA0434 TaxID=3079297 RepID=UPI002905C8AF|nr:hypothetical protein [Roseobacter sp. HKCCA0434]
MTNTPNNPPPSGGKPETDEARRAGEQTREEMKAAARDLESSARAAAQDARHKAETEVRARADGMKEAAASEVSNMANALRTAADELRSGSPQERTFAQIADGLADASDSIRGKDMGEIAGDLSRYARRNPLVFLGGAALIGFAATRFANASARRPYDHDDYEPTGAPRAPAASRAPVAPAGTPPVTRPTPAMQPGLASPAIDRTGGDS